MKHINQLFSSLILIGSLTACGSDSSESTSICSDNIDNDVQWNTLCTTTATKLSDYNLFENQSNPTVNPNGTGIPYDLSTPLFTDYASKYRYIFIPPNKSATYIEDETFNFPVGTTLVKTFALPSNTDNRGFENENLIETRLLIKREAGWIALPYVWNSEKTDAFLDTNGASFPTSITHNGVTKSFNYKVPDPQSCINCHGISQSSGSEVKVTPIGPKARFLNKDYVFDSGTENQLTHWKNAGALTGLPSDLTTVDQAPIVKDNLNLGDLSPSELELAAKSWLDINCAHCHRRDPHGLASNTNMQVEWTRSFSAEPSAHGVCQNPISFGGDAGSYIIEPGNATASLLVFRMNTTDGGDAMPPLGRDMIHTEGVELVSAWINSMPANSNCQ